MTKSTSERYEAISVEWVNALRKYLAEKTKGKNLDFKGTYSAEYTNPPAHLLRGDGRNTIGWTLRVNDREVEVLDGPHHHRADIVTIEAYDPMALSLRMTDDEFQKWYAQHGRRLEAEGKVVFIGDLDVTKLALFMTPFRDEFYVKHTGEKTDVADERYEAGSVEWVNALRKYVAEKASRQAPDFKATASTELTNPPAHLLRGDGHNSIGWTICIKDGKAEVFDGPNMHRADVCMIGPYDPMGLALRMPNVEYLKFFAEHAPRLEAEGKIIYTGDQDVAALYFFMLGIRNEFYSVVTA